MEDCVRCVGLLASIVFVNNIFWLVTLNECFQLASNVVWNMLAAGCILAGAATVLAWGHTRFFKTSYFLSIVAHGVAGVSIVAAAIPSAHGKCNFTSWLAVGSILQTAAAWLTAVVLGVVVCWKRWWPRAEFEPIQGIELA